MTAPLRVQLRRKKGWRMPPNTLSVARPTKWSNPVRVHPGCTRVGPHVHYLCRPTNDAAVSAWVRAQERGWYGIPADDYIRRELRGKNLACWCHLCSAHAEGKPFDIFCDDCEPCHADPLGRLANGVRL